MIDLPRDANPHLQTKKTKAKNKPEKDEKEDSHPLQDPLNSPAQPLPRRYLRLGEAEVPYLQHASRQDERRIKNKKSVTFDVTPKEKEVPRLISNDKLQNEYQRQEKLRRVLF